MENKEIGQKGEDAASEYIINKGFRIIHRNFHIKNIGEIDIIGKKTNWCGNLSELHFIEVKSRVKCNRETIYPEIHVNSRKKEKLITLAQIYCRTESIPLDSKISIDVVGVDIEKNGNIADIRFYENIACFT